MSRRKRSKKAKKNIKRFKHFLELPSELRMMIMKELPAEDRWRITRCSTLCHNEAKSCDNFVYELNIHESYDNTVKITIIADKYEDNGDRKGFVLNFAKSGNKNVLECLKVGDESRLWIQKLDSSIDLVEYAKEHYKSLVMFYHKSIRTLSVIGNLFTNEVEQFDFRTKIFKHLEEHSMSNSFFVLKTRNPLKVFVSIAQVDNEALVANFDQLSKVEKNLQMPFVPFTLDVFQQISAEIFRINIGTLTEDDILKFIRSWQNGTLGRKLDWCEWKLTNSKFDCRRLFQLLGSQQDSYIKLQHNTEAGKAGELRYLDETLQFKTLDSPPQFPIQ